ncbi:MAG: SDR family oxidoreductase [Actinomycetota bacterium]|nr:SDR family oxidoreductase [Actinomycetota bacterium]
MANRESIGASVALQASKAGAEVIFAAFPRDLVGAKEVAEECGGSVAVLGVDATSEQEMAELEKEIRRCWGGLDGALHAIAFAPKPALGSILDVPASAVQAAFTTSVWTYAAFGSMLSRLAGTSGASLVGLDFDSTRAWPVYNWMGPCKAALRSLNSYLARDLAPAGIRANLVAAGPLRTRAASGIPGFETLVRSWERQAPLAWDVADAAPVAEAICFLLSDAARAITGEVLNVDGGMHAMATWLGDGSEMAAEPA